ncbi:hypothetical protein [Citrobacter freundii]|uniref:Uncharacterized protein n=1 Tax=Citrobacter freundii TaxID=546 RepID=A0A7G2IYJ1_CITFR|nr:hypothetical protein [Citrobacter freundii]
MWKADFGGIKKVNNNLPTDAIAAAIAVLKQEKSHRLSN